MICLAHIGFVHSGIERPQYRSSAVFDVIVLLFLFGVFILMVFDKPVGSATVAVTIFGLVPAFAIGWFFVRKRVRKQEEPAEENVDTPAG